MEYAIGSVITLALVLLIFSATVGLSPCKLRALRRHAWVLCVAIASLVTAPDIWALLSIAGPAVAAYEGAILLLG